MNCTAITKSKGTQCTRKIVEGTNFCWQHQANTTIKKTETKELEVKENKVNTNNIITNNNTVKTEAKEKKPKNLEITEIDYTKFKLQKIYRKKYNSKAIEFCVPFGNQLIIADQLLEKLPPIKNFQNVIIVGMSKLVEIPPIHNVKNLDILGCKSLKMFSEIKSLETLKIEHCHTLWSLPSLPELKNLFVDSCNKLSHIPDYPKLVNLKINSCNLDNLCEAKDLEQLIICENLVSKIPSYPKLKVICACNNPVTEIGHYPKLPQSLLINLLELCTSCNYNFGNPKKSENEAWLIENSINKEDFSGDDLDISKGWITVSNNNGFYTYPNIELIKTFASAQNSYIMNETTITTFNEETKEIEEKKTFVHDYDKRIFKEPYSGNWLLIPKLTMLCIFSNFKMRNIGKHQLISGPSDIYVLEPISLSELKKTDGTWGSDDINKISIADPQVLKCEDGIYMGNTKDKTPNGWGFKISQGSISYGTWDKGTLLG
jgi:hypothetical protein